MVVSDYLFCREVAESHQSAWAMADKQNRGDGDYYIVGFGGGFSGDGVGAEIICNFPNDYALSGEIKYCVYCPFCEFKGHKNKAFRNKMQRL